MRNSQSYVNAHSLSSVIRDIGVEKCFLPKKRGLGFNYCTEQQQQFYCYGSIPLLLLIHERRRNSSSSLAFFPKVIHHISMKSVLTDLSASKNWVLKGPNSSICWQLAVVKSI